MGIPETIIAAAIGATATVSTAVFQLYTAMRAKSKAEQRPKRKRMLRSALSLGALAIVSAAGGYLFAEFRLQDAIDDVRTVHQEVHGMRDELNAKLQMLAQTTEHATPAVGGDDKSLAEAEATLLARGCADDACDEAHGERVTLCATVPHGARAGAVDLYVGGTPPSGSAPQIDYRRVEFDQDGGGAKFTGVPFDFARMDGARTLCVDFVHWSPEPHFARVAVQLVPTTSDVTRLAEASGR